MTDFDNVSMSVGAIANAAASRLALMSLTDITLREAIQTVKLGPGEVRVGAWDIIRDNDRFTIRSSKTGDIVHSVAFYDTAQSIVRLLNRGHTPRSVSILAIVNLNDEYCRYRDEAEHQKLRAESLWDTNPYRAEYAEDLYHIAHDRAHDLYKSLPVPADV